MADSRWTTKRPTEVGWYWVCMEWGEVKAIKVIENRGTLITTEADGEYWIDVAHAQYQYWIGPIEVPSISDLLLNNP